MRIVGGRWRGRPLASPTDGAIRPTTDRSRQAIFDTLAHGHGDPVRDATVLDLFAGTGAMGFEALSRGARFVSFVDRATEACGLVRRNMDALGAGSASRLLRRDATRLGRADGPPAGLVFCDPPYRQGLAEVALASARAGGWIAPDALVVIEEAADATVVLPIWLTLADRRVHGAAQILVAQVLEARNQDAEPGSAD